MVPYLIFFLALAFDYKGIEDGGSVIQIILIFITIFSGLFIVIQDKFERVYIDGYSRAALILVVFLASTFLVAYFNGLDLGRYIRIAIPYYFVLLGFLLSKPASKYFKMSELLDLMTVGAMIAIIFTLVYGFLSSGLASEDVRFQILSPMIFFAAPILILNIFLFRRMKLLSISSLLFIFFVVFISATRSWLLTICILMFFGIFIGGAKKLGIARSFFQSIAQFSIVILLLLMLVMIFTPDAFDRLYERIIAGREIGFDVTSATRIAEGNFQIEGWLSDWTSFLFGKGLGASYGFSGEELVELIPVIGIEEASIDWWFAGHNFWIYSLFTQGILFGLILPGLILLVLFKSIYAIARHLQVKTNYLVISESNSIFLKYVMGFFLMGFILSTIGANPLGSRMLSLYLGVLLGYFFIGQQKSSNA